MGSNVSITGLDKLRAKLARNASMQDVKTVVVSSGGLLQNTMKRKTKEVFVKGYSKGDLVGTIGMTVEDGGLTVKVGPSSEYAPYLEYGTRRMSPEPFASPACDAEAPKFKRRLKELAR